MDGSSSPLFDLFAQPFRILCVDPAATDKQLHDAFDRAKLNRLASDDALAHARAAIRDPSKRLCCELSYPIDSRLEDIDALYAVLSRECSEGELLLFSEQLEPLSRANFITHLTAHQPANSALLSALVESHALIDPTRIYEILKAIRRSAGCPAPSLINVNQGLRDLLDAHIEAAMAEYETIQDATEPMLACAEQILALGESYPVEVLGSLLTVYRRYIGPQQKIAAEEIETACKALQQHPADASLLDELMKALQDWLSLCRPLILLDMHYGRVEKEFEVPFELVSDLIAELTAHQHYDVALKIARFNSDAFRAMPTIVEQLNDDVRVIEGLSVQVKIAPLQDLIAELERDPGPLVAALQKDGFGQRSSEPAKALWTAFLQALEATNETKAADPWRVTRNLAMRLNHNLKVSVAASILIAGLIDHAEKAAAAPEILDALREDLERIQRTDPIEGASTGGMSQSLEAVFDVLWKRSPARNIPVAIPVANEIPAASEVSVGNKIPVGRKPTKASGKTRSRVAVIALFGAICAFGLYLVFNKAPSGSPNTTVSPILPLTDSAQQGSLDAEIVPPVGRGQRFTLGNVRYCHFQEERLKIMKPDVRGPEAVRAFNLLVVDYNSRCSDFLYKDSDVEAVTAELRAKRPLLEADAKRIMSTWPGRGSSDPAALPKQ